MLLALFLLALLTIRIDFRFFFGISFLNYCPPVSAVRVFMFFNISDKRIKIQILEKAKCIMEIGDARSISNENKTSVEDPISLNVEVEHSTRHHVCSRVYS